MEELTIFVEGLNEGYLQRERERPRLFLIGRLQPTNTTGGLGISVALANAVVVVRTEQTWHLGYCDSDGLASHSSWCSTGAPRIETFPG